MNNKALLENEIVLVYVEKQPAFFARVEKIVPDSKKGWWQVTFLLLRIPLSTITWIIDNDQIRGADFTMGGVNMRIEQVKSPLESEKSKTQQNDESNESRGARILSLNKNKS